MNEIFKTHKLNIEYVLCELNGDFTKHGQDENLAKEYYKSKGFKVLHHPFSRSNQSKLRQIIGTRLDILKKFSRGHSDLFVYSETEHYFVEVKSINFGLSNTQLIFFNKVNELGLKSVVFRIIELGHNGKTIYNCPRCNAERFFEGYCKTCKDLILQETEEKAELEALAKVEQFNKYLINERKIKLIERRKQRKKERKNRRFRKINHLREVTKKDEQWEKIKPTLKLNL